jgi:hypothetical protein
MRMKTLLGLAAIGGAVAYAQKKRGGELTIEGFKKTARELFNSLGAKSTSAKRSSGMRAADEDPPSYGSSGRAGTTPRTSYGDDVSGSPNGINRR